MKSQALSIVKEATSPHQAYLKLREFLQHVILRILFEQKVLLDWVFHGGTALRIVYDLNRFSEDLDFHLTTADPDYSLSPVISKLIKALELQGYSIGDTVVKEKTVRTAYIKFNDLLFESGLTVHRDEKLSIKLEVDTNPPDGFQCETALINTFFPFSFTNHDPGSFLA
ncbi:MAG: nucleotidyl transferase AbiEii/AbiGii toxin family protein, partial [FCB group bacterium]|nr:nucleotidyl transferase AbiEii/AbiGii toxin family protein [FCB group bacterium]